MTKKKWFVCTSFTGHNPVGVAALVYEENHGFAAIALNRELERRGLVDDVTANDMKPLDEYEDDVVILNDGDY